MSAQVEFSNGGQEDDSWFIDSIANFTSPSSSTGKIHRVPTMMKGTEDQYQKYFVPKVVSIGPYHHGNPKLDLVEKLKPFFTMKLLSNKENLRSLWTKFGEPNKVQELRNFYEENSTVAFGDKVFVKMMLLDACFILYCILHFFGDQSEDCQDLKSHQIVLVRQDLLLLENQIPFQVLEEAMKLMNIKGEEKIKPFIIDNILACGEHRKSWCESIYSTVSCCNPSSKKSELDFDSAKPDHLLHLLHLNLTKGKVLEDKSNQQTKKKRTFRNVSELKDVGIQFKPSSTMSLANVKFCRCCRWCFSASVELPPITVDDSTKPKLLNLIAYEMCSHDARSSWVTSYICLLDTLIDHPEDVKTLRKAGVLDNFLGSDNEVAKLFNEISTDLVPNYLAYLDAKNKIQSHYESWSNGLISQLKHEYVKSPWAYIALLGAFVAFFLSGAQTYYTVWSPKGACDDLCTLLKNNHHL